jgi:hypothetical protein
MPGSMSLGMALSGRMLERCGVILAHELKHRRLHEIRIAEVDRAIPVRALHGRDDPVLARRRVDVAQIDAAQDIERIEQRDASR